MASSTQIQDLLYKKLLRVSDTNPGKPYQNEPYSSNSLVFQSQLLTYSIPSSAPTQTTVDNTITNFPHNVRYVSNSVSYMVNYINLPLIVQIPGVSFTGIYNSINYLKYSSL